MLFGWNRVGERLHFFSTLMVAVGTLISTFWILASNSWMHTPQGHEIIDGIGVPVDWLAILFTPSFPYRLAQMAVAALIATAVFVGGWSAWPPSGGRDNPAQPQLLAPAYLFHAHGGRGHSDLDLLDSGVQQLDAHAAGARDHRRHRGAGGLVGDHRQPVVPLSTGAHGGRRVPRHGVLRRRVGGLAAVARQGQPGDPQDALDGHVDGPLGGTGAGGDRRFPWAEHPRVSAGEDSRHGRALGQIRRRADAAVAVRRAGTGGIGNASCREQVG